MNRNDILWKGIIEDIFDDILKFLYPDAEEIFDFSQGFEFLDKELEELFPQKDSENIRFVDKLVKVHHRKKGSQWFLFHVEVQGYTDPDFGERMFTYYYRIRDKYQMRVTSWAFFTDSRKTYHPTKFEESFLGTKLNFEFNTLKILTMNEEVLKKSKNPFSTVLLTAILALKNTSLSPSKLLDLKLDLARNLLLRGFEKEKVRAILNFLRFYVRLDDDSDISFERKLDFVIGKTYPMGIEQLILELERKEGVKEGIEKGIEKGI
ncbi:MAG: hypothetical protein EA362_12540, partial [Saprospirales bacterium]